MPNAKNKTYRNYYCANKENPDYQEWEAMVSCGLATKRIMGKECCGDYFYLTVPGAMAAILPHEKIGE